MPNNKVGLVTRLGGSSYTIPVIVRLLENLPEQSSEMEEMLEKIQESLLITERFHEIGRERKEILKQQRLERKKQEQQEKEKKNAAEAAAKEERKKKRMDETAARKEVKRLEKLQNPKKI